MRSLLTVALLASVAGPLATSAFAADLDDLPPPRLYAPHPVPPAYVPGPVPPIYVPRRVPPVVYREPPVVVVPRAVYARPYAYEAPRPVVRVYGEPRPYAEGYERYDRDDRREAYRRESYERDVARGPEHEGRRYEHERETERYGHYLSREDLDRRADRERADDRRIDRNRFERDDRYADRAFGRDYDR